MPPRSLIGGAEWPPAALLIGRVTYVFAASEVTRNAYKRHRAVRTAGRAEKAQEEVRGADAQRPLLARRGHLE